MHVTILWMICDVGSECRKDCSVESFHLTVDLETVGDGINVIIGQCFAYVLKKHRRELLAVICFLVYGLSVVENPVVHKVIGYLC